ncbi:MAG: DNA internalization-related competence protein ComEC/Rec2 [Gemmatimonadaceae bacterium]
MVFATGVAIAALSPQPASFHARPPKASDADLMPMIRAHAARKIDRVFGEDAGIARALLIADQREIPTAMRDRYAAAGLVHMLSISGLHVAVIASAMELLFQVARLSRRAALLSAFVSTAVYVAIIGAPAPALRSAAMLGVAMASRLAQRPTSPWAALALGAFAPLVDPRTVVDLGYQLSVLGMCGLIAGGAASRRYLGDLSGWRLYLSRELAMSLVACAVTAPLVAYRFGQISFIAPVSNLLAAPVIGLAQPMLFLALLVAPAEGLARFCAQAAHPLLVAFDQIAASAASIPGASTAVHATWMTAGLAAIAAGAIVVACVGRFPARPALVAVATLSLMVHAPVLPVFASGEAELHVLDVGQGDAALLRTPRGRWVLLDAGPAWDGGDAGRTTILPYLRRYRGALEAFVLSHPHTDHVGGAASVLAELEPPTYWDAAFAGGSVAYIASLATARSEGIEWRRVHPGDAMTIDGVRIWFLAPDSAWTAGLTDPNLASTVTMIEYGVVRFLLVGDAELEEEEWLLRTYPAGLRADVLKVAHHGSSTSSSDAFLAAVSPRAAIISVGARNKYGHPSKDVLRALLNAGAEIYRTDQQGTVVARTNGSRLELEAGGEKWELDRE